MLTEAEIEKLFVLLGKEDIGKGEIAQLPEYRWMVEEYDRLSLCLCDKLDDRRAELFARIVKLRETIETYRCLHYMHRGMELGKKK